MAVVPYALLRATTLGDPLPAAKEVVLRQMAIANPIRYGAMQVVRDS